MGASFSENGIDVTDASIFKVPKDVYVRVSLSTKEENREFVNFLREKIKKKR